MAHCDSTIELNDHSYNQPSLAQGTITDQIERSEAKHLFEHINNECHTEYHHSSGQVVEQDREEQQNFFDIINTFQYYKSYNLKKVVKRMNYIDKMPLNHQEKLEKYRRHLEQVKVAFEHNFEVIKVLIHDATTMFQNTIYLKNKNHGLILKSEKELDIPRVDSILNQIVREWCKEGLTERNSSFERILSAIDEFFSVQVKHKVRILVPGAGLGRLVFEIAKNGYSCQGNEFSMMMLMVANYILNKTGGTNVLSIYPWVSQFSNNLYSEHQLVKVTFPDVNPSQVANEVEFSMVAGPFAELYGGPQECQSFDCVATSFFLDTAPNIVAYIETIWNVLKPNGIWINFGPLLYHYADMSQRSIEPSYEIVRDIILSFNFKFLREESNLPSYYTRNPNSMVSYEYQSVFFICKKES